MDDLTQRGADPAKGEAVSSRFVTFVETLRRLNVKAALGIIGNSLADGSPEYFAWIKAVHAEGIVEFWNHGYTHAEQPRENGRRRTEFTGASLEEQTESFAKTQRLAKEKLGFDLKAFGSPFNQVDATTEKVLDAFPEVTSWFYGRGRPNPSRRILERRMDLEVPVMQPNSAQLIDAYNQYGKDLQYIVLQGHPNGWGGKQLAEFTKAVEFLKAQGCTFMTPSEFLRVELRAATLPPMPAAGKPAVAAGKTVVAAPATPTPEPVPVPEPVIKPQLLANPTLLDSDGNGLPEGWYRSTRQSGTVAKCTDDSGRFLRIGVETPGESIIFQQMTALPAGGEPITVAAKVRWKDIVRGQKGYMSGCVQMMFADDAGKKVGDYLPVASFKGASQGWHVVGRSFARPEGATKFRVQLALYSVQSGSLDIAWATVATGGTPACPAPEELARQNAPTTAPDETLAGPSALP
jgi:peptidoglycan/xylan/chitin deacetylase (PgdA/CDA1 family)